MNFWTKTHVVKTYYFHTRTTAVRNIDDCLRNIDDCLTFYISIYIILNILFFCRYHAKCNIHSPILPTKYPDKEREAYQATRDKHDDTISGIVRLKE